MFLYLSKKISMPNGVKLKSLSWNTQQEWLACGGDDGLLKVLKLDTGCSTGERNQKSSMTTSSNLSMNQTLEGHHGTVAAVSWNQNYRKLTSSDENGLIIVWVLFKGMWFEEMINNRNKSVVQDLRWSSDGQKICIVYKDGQVVMGNVDGNRLWAKELNVQLSLVEWSPDAKLILFCTMQGTCLIYDCSGNYVSQLVICFISDGDYASIIGIEWYNGSEGHTDLNAPTLALALESGKLQLMRHELDEDPILVDMRMNTVCMKWNPDGEVLAAIGSEVSGSPVASTSMVQLYSNSGIHLRTLRVPGTQTSALSWEGGGLRLALAVDAYIYLANIRPEYKWAFFGNSTCVYGFRKQDHAEHSVMFWDISTNERYCKYVNHLVAVTGAGEHCVLATRGEEPAQYVLILCNAIGNPVDSRNVAVEPLYITMNSTRVFVASEDTVYVWKYEGSSESQSSSPDSGLPSESIFQIDEPQASADESKEEEVDSSDQICCICCSEKYFIVGRESGIMHRYDLPRLNLETKDLLQCRPQVLELNCNSSRLSVIDMNGVLTFYDLLQAGETTEPVVMSARVPEFERKDVWSVKWADDNPDLLAAMEKARMYIFRGTDPEEPVACTAYLCNFHNLQIQAVQLDEVMSQPEQPGKDHVFNYETKSLRDTQQMLRAVEIQDAFSYVEEHSHPRLWMSLAEHALEKLNLPIAEKAFVKCQHYYGIQFVKGLHFLKDKRKQQAEICVYFGRFDAAQAIYREMDRKDLAIDMRMKMGHWFIVESLISESGAGNDSLRELTWNNIGKFYAARRNWSKAVPYFEKAKNCEKLAECYYALQSWPDLEKLMDSLHDGSPLLLNIAKMFASFGICGNAVTGFIRGGDVESALDCCMELNHWDKAMELSRTYDTTKSVAGAISKYTKFLLQSGNPLLAVEVYDKAGQHQLAAKVLNSLAHQLAERRRSPLEVKKLFVLAALQVEAYRASIIGMQSRATGVHDLSGGSTSSRAMQSRGQKAKTDPLKSSAAVTLDGLIQHDAAATLDKSLENAWHGAEAYHLWLLAHRELYAGHFDQAMKASWWLRNYEDVLTVEDIYSLIALTAFYSKHYAQCSQAFVKLEALKDIPESRQNEIAQVALAIFTQYSPVSSNNCSRRNCPDCGALIQELEPKCPTPTCSAVFPICMASGTLIVDEDHVQCTTCKHWLLSTKIRGCKHCPLCHSPLTTSHPHLSAYF